MPDIETSRLIFRKFTPDDLQDLYAIRSDPEVMKYIGPGRPESEAGVQAVLNKALAHWEQHAFGPWALIDKDSKQLIGWCGLRYMENTENVEIAYGLEKSHWGKGLASEAAAPTIKYGFEQIRLDRIVAIACPDNIASQKVMVKSGMKYEKRTHFCNSEVVYFVISRDEYTTTSR